MKLLSKRRLIYLGILALTCAFAGCKTPTEHREKADETAYSLVRDKQQEALGKTEDFSIERPSTIFRRRLLEAQGLPYASDASLGTDRLQPIEYWPEEDYPHRTDTGPKLDIKIDPQRAVRLSLLQALQVGARNSSQYQDQKESIFRSALALDLQRNNFRNIFQAQADSQVTADVARGESPVVRTNNGGSVGVTRTLKNGASLSAALAVDLASLLTQSGSSSLGLSGDASVSVPLLRGAGRHIVTEPLTQAERNVVYDIHDFQRFKRSFAVGIAQGYFSVLRQMDSRDNAKDNYESAITSARWSSRRADAGRIPEIEVDQAMQRQLSARNGWISAQENLKSRLDAFKISLGLPPDAQIDLDPNDLEHLRARAEKVLEEMQAGAQREVAEVAPHADADVELIPASYEDAGALEIDEARALQLAFDNRLDLLVATGEVYDAQRWVVRQADQLRAELTIGASAAYADNDDDGSLNLEQGQFAAPLSLDLPLERTAERNAYRNSLIALEQATRNVQSLEDQIKLSIRNQLRALLESRETMKIQAQSVVVAEKRVRSSNLFLEAGRIQIRDLLEAQDARLAARNDLTAAVINYRIAELELQRDMGVLNVNEDGLWQEFVPEVKNHVRQQDTNAETQSAG
jgi:outer membrane protein TolC